MSFKRKLITKEKGERIIITTKRDIQTRNRKIGGLILENLMLTLKNHPLTKWINNNMTTCALTMVCQDTK